MWPSVASLASLDLNEECVCRMTQIFVSVMKVWSTDLGVTGKF
jgi:hypothetical protein